MILGLAAIPGSKKHPPSCVVVQIWSDDTVIYGILKAMNGAFGYTELSVGRRSADIIGMPTIPKNKTDTTWRVSATGATICW